MTTVQVPPFEYSPKLQHYPFALILSVPHDTQTPLSNSVHSGSSVGNNFTQVAASPFNPLSLV